MRLPTSRIWRAFPELDRFSDQQCAAFVKAARRKWGWRAVRLAVMAASVPVAMSAAGLVHITLTGAFGREKSSAAWEQAATVVGGILAIVIVCAVLFGAVLMRDRLLRWRIRYALFNRGTCIGCRYALLGLPVSEENMVVCPECGLETKVDPALGELAQSDNGGRVLRPVDERLLPKPRKVFWTARRLRRVGAALLTVVVVAVIGKVGWWWAEKLRLESQAQRAAAERHGAGALNELQEKLQPATSDKPDGWRLLSTASIGARTVDGKVWSMGNGPKHADGTDAYPEYSWLRTHPEEEFRVRAQAEEALARTMLAELKAAGVFDDLRKLSEFERAVWPFRDNAAVPVSQQGMADLSGSRNLARINSGRMGLAVQNDDPAEFVAALNANLAISRLLRTHPMLISDLVAMAIDTLTHECVVAAIMTRPTKPWIDTIDAALRRNAAGVPAGTQVRGERESMLDLIAWYFSDPARVKDWRSTAPTVFGTAAVDDDGSLRIGTYEENRDAVKALMENLELRLKTERWLRKSTPASPDTGHGLVLVKPATVWMPRYAESVDARTLQERGLRTMVALEKFRLREGNYPAGLQELAPRDLPELPLDPWSGNPLGYKLVRPADALGRGYVLYSVGADGVDNQGAEGARHDRWSALGSRPPPGVDYIINYRDP